MRRLDLIHHVVAGVNAGGAGNAFLLQSIADINTGRADLYAHGAIHTETERFRVLAILFFQAVAWLAAFGVVGNDEGVAVEHCPLKAGIRAKILAELFAHDTRLQVAKAAVEGDPQISLRVGAQGEEVGDELADGGEITDETDTGGKRHPYPQAVFKDAFAPFPATPRLARKFELLGAVTFDFLLNPEKNFGVNGVRTGITTPDAPQEGGRKEEQQREAKQDEGKQDEILRPDIEAEDIETAVRHVEENGLTPVPLEKGQDVEDAEQHQQGGFAQAGKTPLDGTRTDFDVFLVEGFACCCGTHDDAWLLCRNGASL